MNVIQRSIRPLLILALLYGQTANVCGATLCSPPCLLVANTSDIVAMDYKTAALSSVVSGLTRAVAIDIHFSLGYIFWSDVTEQNIKRFRIDVASTTTIITGIGVCDGLAVDWRASQLYWTDTTYDTISVSDLNGNNQVLLISSSLEEPRAIALDLDNSLMFWTDWGTNKKIERASLNGGQRVAMVTTELFYPNGIELDTGNKRIFWVDAGLDRVESVDYNGNNRKLLYQLSGLHPFGLTLIPPFLFFTDWVTAEDIHQLDATTGSVVRKFSVNGGRPMGIVAYGTSRQPAASNPCTVNNGGCSHFCVTKSSGYECVCPTGLAVKQDGKTCEDKVKKFILFADADDKSTKYISLDTTYPASQTLFHHLGTQRPIALDYDPVEDRVYWSENTQGRIISAFFNATSVKTLFHCNVRTPDGLAIDYVGRNIYWTDTGTNRIEVGKLDGTRRKLLIKGGLDEPRAIILDEKNGMMYWTDWGSSPKIEKAEMDGSARRIIVMGNLVWPNGLTIDQATKRLFWADAKLDKIEVSDLNGGNRQLIMSSVADIHPYGLAVYHDMLYWTDWNAKSISNYNLSAGNKDTLVDGLQQPMDIHIFDPALIFSGSHNCSQDNGLCSDFCLLKPGGYQCACPTGIALKSDGKTCNHDVFDKTSSDKFVIFAEADIGEIYKVPLEVPETPCYPLEISTNISRPVAVDYDPVEGKIYWSDVTLELVARAFPNGSFVDVIAYNNVITPEGLAIDYIGRNIYWTDEANNRIEVARMDGSSRRSLITSNIEKPRAILLDIGERKMYWGGRGISLKIERANMDGSARTTLVSSGLTWVNSLAMDYQSRLLYWCDGYLDKIERVDLQGNNRVVILDLSLDSMHPFGLALFGDVLFWSDWKSRSIHKYNMTTSVTEVVVHGMGRPMELHVYDQSQLFTGTTSCSQLNGGCSHICLPNPSGHQCFCPEGVQLKPGDAFTCEGVNSCPQLTAPAHGSLAPCNNFPGHICHFSCDTGYILTGSAARTCDSNGLWTGIQPQCNAVACSALQAPRNGIRQGCTGTTTEYYNTVCLFSCNAGFIPTGSPSRKCLSNGTWSGQDFICQAVSCVPLGIPPRAVLLTASCGNTYGSNCVFGCQIGYGSVDGNVTRTCLQTGQWSRNPINCTDVLPPTFGVTCPASPLLVYAERGKFSALVIWNEPNATDNSGAAPSLWSSHKPPQRLSQGTHVITYTAMDHSGNRATCYFYINVVVISCTSLTVNSGGELRMSSCGSYFGAHCNFTCAVGYRLNGSSTVTCVTRGNTPPGYWDNPLPSCQGIRCPSLPTPTDGVKTGCTNVAGEPYNTQCSFSCNVGYNRIGSSVRRCLENGTWSGVTSYCRVITCGPLVPPTDGVVHVSPSSCLMSSPYGQTCTFTCQKPGYVLEGTSVRVCGNDGQWTGPNSTNCRDNTPPSFNNTCPDNKVFYATECSSSALLTWTEPLATDNSGHVSISYPATRPPVNLSIGLYNVLYSAIDSSGNRANCTFIVQVARKSCSVLQPPIHGSIASFSCGSSFGSQAFLSCDTGYHMTGSLFRSCRADGTWSGNVTTCNIVKCPSIAAPSHGMVFPSTCQIPSGVNYKSECFFKCNITVGYQLEGSSKVSCLESGSWSNDTTKTICRDIQPPSITCPPDIDNITTVPGQSYASVQWQLPVSTDNSNDPLTLTGLRPPQKLNVGKTHITYEVTDSSGLSRSCVFVIHIKDLEPPRIANCPDDIHKTSKQKLTKVFFPGVTVTDNVAVHLFTTNRPNGSEFTWGEHNVTYTVSDKAGNTAKCHFQVIIIAKPCDDLPAPQNGAKACDKWLVGGKVCTLHCNAGYDFANEPPKFYACGAGGIWFPDDTVPDCSKVRQANTLLDSELHYLAYQCTVQMHSRIARNFIALYTDYLGTVGGCDGDVECTIENVEVDCGAQSGILRRRDIADGEQPSKVPITVKFAVKVPLPSNASVADLNQTTQRISSNILASLNETDLTLNVSGVVLEYDTTKPPVVRILGLVCDKGQVLKGTKCVNCPLGYFFNSSGCQACVKDHYQDQEAQSECVTCPTGTSTFGHTGSKGSKDCKEIPTPSSTEKQVIPAMILYPVIALGFLLVIAVTVVAIVFLRKRRLGKRQPEGNIGFDNQAYGQTNSIQGNEPEYLEIGQMQQPSVGFPNPSFEHYQALNYASVGPNNVYEELNISSQSEA